MEIVDLASSNTLKTFRYAKIVDLASSKYSTPRASNSSIDYASSRFGSANNNTPLDLSMFWLSSDVFVINLSIKEGANLHLFLH